MNPDRTALSPETWPFSLEWLPTEACLVGGAVRDALLCRQAEYLDLDFVLPTNALEIARQLANHYNAGFVVLDAQRQIARVVFDNATVDLAQQEGDSLETDLRRRDFTVNAIAYNPHTHQFIDPHQGVRDLKAGSIRMVSQSNLADDPLRLLRAYRQAAQLGFQIEPATHRAICQLSPLLQQVAAERVQVELGYLLKSAQGTPWLTAAWEDHLLQGWFPDAAEGLGQVRAVDEAVILLAATWSELGGKLQTPISGKSATLGSLTKLACLLPAVPDVAEAQLLKLKYARAEIRTVMTMLKHLPQLRSHATTPMSRPEQYFFFQAVGSVFPALAVLAVAGGVPVKAIGSALPKGIAPLIDRYLNPEDQVAHPTPLVTGKELMQALHLPPGPQVGQLLTEIQIARIEGAINNRDAALAFASRLFNSPHSS